MRFWNFSRALARINCKEQQLFGRQPGKTEKMHGKERKRNKTPEKLVELATESLWSYQQAKRKDEINPPMAAPQRKWTRSPLGMVKIITDAGIFKGENAIGLGAIIRNDQEEVPAAKTRRKDGLVDVVGAKLMAAVEGLKLTRQQLFWKGIQGWGLSLIEKSTVDLSNPNTYQDVVTKELIF